MHLQCNRFIFTYTSNPEIVKDYILRSDDLSKRVYGRDLLFSRTNQVMDFARFLGWDIPRFAGNLPEEFSDISPVGIDHIFENQAKLLVDVAPVSRVLLENGKYFPVRMVCGTTPAGDLVWKTHLLTDREGCPYVTRKGKHYRVKTKGTQVVCQSETVPYDEQYIIDCFGGGNGVFPVPFLPEFFSDQPLAQLFSPEMGVVEIVTMVEPEPLHVIAKDVVPWYRALELDRTKALPLDEDYDDFYSSSHNYDEKEVKAEPNLDDLVSGWDHLSDGEQFAVDDEETEDYEEDLEDEGVIFTNIVVTLSSSEKSYLEEAENNLKQTKIENKKEAEELRKDPKNKDRAEKWLLNAVNRLRVLSSASAKVGALVSLVNKHQNQQILVLQPREKWAVKLAETLKQKGSPAEYLGVEEDNKQSIRSFYDGKTRLLVSSQAREELFIDDLVIISVTSFDNPAWLEYLNPTHTVYTIVLSDLGYSDFNLINDHPCFEVATEDYEGPVLDILGIEEPKKTPKAKPKFTVKVSEGKNKKFPSQEKALEFVQKQEKNNVKCEIYPPDSKEAIYITGIGEIK